MNSDRHWMQQALLQAQQAEQCGEVPVGAVLVCDDTLLAAAHNGPIMQHDPTAHAEIMVMRQAARLQENYRLPGVTLYVTLEPCAMCFGAMQHARIARCVFGATDPKTGMLGGADELQKSAWAMHQMEVLGGVLHDECAALLKTFFQRKR